MIKPKSQRHVRAGQARHRRLLEQRGEDGYRQFQQQAHAAMKRKYGEVFAKACIAKAHETRRQWRIANPTPGEAAVALALTAAGSVVHADGDQPFEYALWQASGADGYTTHEVIREAKIGPYYADILLPMQALVIEIVGGVHCLTEARDRQHRMWLESQGLRVVIIDEATATTPEALAASIENLCGGGDITSAANRTMKRMRRWIVDILNTGGFYGTHGTLSQHLCDGHEAWAVTHWIRGL